MSEKKATSTNTSDREISSIRIFNAPRDLVFKMWIDPHAIGKWWGPRGFTTTTHKMEVRPGGEWRFIMHGPDGTDFPNKIVYIDVKEPERLVYKHTGDEGPVQVKFHVTVTFEDLGGKTKISMLALFETAEARNHVAEKYGAVEGMHETLARLAEQVEKFGQ